MRVQPVTNHATAYGRVWLITPASRVPKKIVLIFQLVKFQNSVRGSTKRDKARQFCRILSGSGCPVRVEEIFCHVIGQGWVQGALVSVMMTGSWVTGRRQGAGRSNASTGSESPRSAFTRLS
jgi:hypothetical protein